MPDTITTNMSKRFQLFRACDAYAHILYYTYSSILYHIFKHTSLHTFMHTLLHIFIDTLLHICSTSKRFYPFKVSGFKDLIV